MRAEISYSIIFVLLFAAQPVQARQVTCPKDLKWGDATYAQRTTRIEGLVSKADIEIFSNATVSHLEFNGIAGALIMLGAKGDPSGINLTFGAGQPKPFEFAEIAMVVEPPMTHGAWPRFSGPCAVKDGVVVNFDETEISPSLHSTAATPQKFHITLKRDGLRILYSMAVENEPGSDRGAETWQGVWQHDRKLKSFSLETDVQGWHVFRANTYLMTLPIGTAIPLGAALKRANDPGNKN